MYFGGDLRWWLPSALVSLLSARPATDDDSDNDDLESLDLGRYTTPF